MKKLFDKHKYLVRRDLPYVRDKIIIKSCNNFFTQLKYDSYMMVLNNVID